MWSGSDDGLDGVELKVTIGLRLSKQKCELATQGQDRGRKSGDEWILQRKPLTWSNIFLSDEDEKERCHATVLAPLVVSLLASPREAKSIVALFIFQNLNCLDSSTPEIFLITWRKVSNLAKLVSTAIPVRHDDLAMSVVLLGGDCRLQWNATV